MTDVAPTVTRSRSFDVWNEVPLVAQSSGMNCWAAAAAMIVGWRERRPVDAAAIASGTGMWAAYRDGLRPSDVDELARLWNLELEERSEWSIDALREVLEAHGPVWMGEASPGLHSIVVTGMYGDASADATFVRINDPWPVGTGERYTRTWRELKESFHTASELIGVPAHVLHARSGDAGNRRSWSVSEERVEQRDEEGRHHRIESHEEVRMSSARFTGVGHPDEYPLAEAATLVRADERFLNTDQWTDNPLASHGGRGENLYLRWNDLPDDAREIDVVVHLHGYQAMEPDAALTRHKARMSGLDPTRRERPTLCIMPRGRRISPDEVQRRRTAYEACVAEGRRNCRQPRSDVYTFPGLVAGGGTGLERLITGSLAWVGREVLHRPAGAAPAIGRLILTAHSGGGADLDTLLRSHSARRTNNPDEVHVFDALYGGTTGLTAWLEARIRAGAATGGLRIAYRAGEGTGANARAVATAIARLTTDRGYRAEAVTLPHNDIPGTCGPIWLHDVRADLPSSATGSRAPAPSRAHELVAPLEYEEDSDMTSTEVATTLSLDSDARAWLAADPSARAALDASVSSWINSTDTSGIELIADEARRRRFLSEVNWSTQVFPGWEGDSTESAALFAALAAAVPERRVPRLLRYRDVHEQVVPVPGQPGKLWPEAKDKFVEMAAAAAHAGITLHIASANGAYRSEETQRAAAARNRNRFAVAQGHSAHSYGLAVDLRLSVANFQVAETTTRPMTNIIRMYRSPVYKWLALHAREFGFYPYRMEPWHFEYNPPGLRARYEGTSVAQAYGAPLGLFEAYRADPPEAPEGSPAALQEAEARRRQQEATAYGVVGADGAEPDAYGYNPPITTAGAAPY